jgi:hypothetical protein
LMHEQMASLLNIPQDRLMHEQMASLFNIPQDRLMHGQMASLLKSWGVDTAGLFTVHCHVYKSPSWDPILSHINPICRDYRLLSGPIPQDLHIVSKGLFCAVSHFRKKRIYVLERECFYFIIIKPFIVSRSRYVRNSFCVLL